MLRDIIFRYAPYLIAGYGIVSFPVLIRRGLLLRRQEQRRSSSFVPGRGLVVEVKTSSRPFGADTGQAQFIDHHLVRCRYRAGTAGFEGWAQDQPVGGRWRVGAEVAIWFDPAHPEAFLLRPPKAGARAGAEQLPLFAVPVIVLLVSLGLAGVLLRH